MKTKGDIAIQLALAMGLITQDQLGEVCSPGWDLQRFVSQIGVGQEFEREVIKIQEESKSC